MVIANSSWGESPFDKITHVTDRGKPIDMVALDFSKAFDVVFRSPAHS